jgi:hypothetical protein
MWVAARQAAGIRRETAGTLGAHRGRVTHRIDVARQGATITFAVEGLLDAAAVAALQASVAAARAAGGAVRIVLKAGTQVDRECLAALRALEADLAAESPYLARWIAGSADATVLHDPDTGATGHAATVEGHLPERSGQGASRVPADDGASARRERG